MKVKVLGVKIDQINLVGTLTIIDSWIDGKEQKMIATVNAEFLVAAQSNSRFKEILNSVDLATCDGSGPQLAAEFLRGIKLNRVAGSDLTVELLKNKKLKIFFLGGSKQVIEILSRKLVQDNIAGYCDGGRLKNDYQLENNEILVDQINSSDANLLLVAFGQVKQEMWIKNNLPRLPNIKVAIGVGVTFDFLAGLAKRAPKWIRTLGLEWLYRLIKEPQRWRRIWNATVYFSWLVLKEKIKHR